jgi:hypothetical protein
MREREKCFDGTVREAAVGLATEMGRKAPPLIRHAPHDTFSCKREKEALPQNTATLRALSASARKLSALARLR